MTRLRKISIAMCLALLGAGFAPAARADAWNKKTYVTFPEPVVLSGTVLQPGRYVMELVDSPSNRHIVRVSNADQTQVHATVLAIPKYRPEPAEETVLTFDEASSGQPRPLRSWFYPGDTIGQEFRYRGSRATQIAAMTQRSLRSTELARPPAEETRESQPATAQPEAPAPTQEPQPAQADKKSGEKAGQERMPATASSLPLLALAGFCSLGAALALHRVIRRT